jgi:hypothetical protein
VPQHEQGFVYVRSGLSRDEVKELLDKLATEESYYFVRSPHAVSGICMKLPEEFFPGFEGQMFNADRELRWKKQGSAYQALLLSRVEADLEGFEPIDKDCEWQICDRTAYFHPLDEPNSLKLLSIKEKRMKRLSLTILA